MRRIKGTQEQLKEAQDWGEFPGFCFECVGFVGLWWAARYTDADLGEQRGVF